MKVTELSLVEAPAGLFAQAGRRIGATALRMVPGVAAQSKSAQLTGRADQGAIANQLMVDFSKWIGQKGKKVPEATRADVAAYFQSRGIQSPMQTSNTIIPQNQLDQAFRNAATQQIQGGQTQPSASPSQPAAALPAAAQAKSGQQTPQQTQPAQQSRVNPAKLPGATQYGNGNWKVPASDGITNLIIDRSGRIISLEKIQSSAPPPPHMTGQPGAIQPRKQQRRQQQGSPLVRQMKQSDA